jgi:hypothetical protein
MHKAIFGCPHIPGPATTAGYAWNVLCRGRSLIGHWKPLSFDLFTISPVINKYLYLMLSEHSAALTVNVDLISCVAILAYA